jgi:hypothetical protein
MYRSTIVAAAAPPEPAAFYLTRPGHVVWAQSRRSAPGAAVRMCPVRVNNFPYLPVPFPPGCYRPRDSQCCPHRPPAADLGPCPCAALATLLSIADIQSIACLVLSNPPPPPVPFACPPVWSPGRFRPATPGRASSATPVLRERTARPGG